MFRQLSSNPIAVIESPNLVSLESLTSLTLSWNSFQCRPQPPIQGWTAFSLTEPPAVHQSLPNCTEISEPSTPLSAQAPSLYGFLHQTSKSSSRHNTTNQWKFTNTLPSSSSTNALTPEPTEEHTSIHGGDTSARHRISIFIDVNCIPNQPYHHRLVIWCSRRMCVLIPLPK